MKKNTIIGFLAGGITGIISTLLVLSVIVWYGVLAYPLPWKTTDPTDPGFDPEKFKFSDYDLSDNELARALVCLFPVGTDKEFVDKILVDTGGAMVEKIEIPNKDIYHPNEYRYTHSSFRQRLGHAFHSLVSESTRFRVRYDPSNKVEGAGFLSNKCHRGDKK